MNSLMYCYVKAAIFAILGSLNQADYLKLLDEIQLIPEFDIQKSDRTLAAKNSFTIKGKGGVPPLPNEPLDSANIIINSEITSTPPIVPEPIETRQGKIQLARGAKVTQDGRVILTAYRTSNADNRLAEIKRNCNQI